MKTKLLLVTIIFVIGIGIAQGNRTVNEGENFTIGTYITPFIASGYQTGFTFDETYLRIQKIESAKAFRIRQTYFGNVSTNNSVIVFEFLIGNQFANISGNLFNITFKGVAVTPGTDIHITQWLIADADGRVNRSFVSRVYDTIKIEPAPVFPPDIPITYQGLMMLVSHFADPVYDQTGDGITDLEDFIKISKQLN